MLHKIFECVYSVINFLPFGTTYSELIGCLFSVVFVTFLLVPRGRLRWLPVSALTKVKYFHRITSCCLGQQLHTGNCFSLMSGCCCCAMCRFGFRTDARNVASRKLCFSEVRLYCLSKNHCVLLHELTASDNNATHIC